MIPRVLYYLSGDLRTIYVTVVRNTQIDTGLRLHSVKICTTEVYRYSTTGTVQIVIYSIQYSILSICILLLNIPMI